MKLEDILLEHGKKKGLGKLELDNSGVCRMLVNETCVVTFEKSLNGKGFYMYASVGSVTPEREKELGLMALGGNLFGRETGQANLGYLPKSRSLVLFEYLDEDSTYYAIFEQKFEQFVQYLAYWINKVELREAPGMEEISLDKHVFDLQEHRNLKIFFA